MKLALGTVQFGLDYGITNQNGKIPKNEAIEILKTAQKNNIKLLDTASAYGNSEQVLGKLVNHDSVNFITKISSHGEQVINIKKSVNTSLNDLQSNSLYGVLFHKETDLLGAYGENYYQQLQQLQQQGIIEKIGASFYSLQALERALGKFKLDLIQIPASCLDQRFQQSGLLKEAKKQNIEVHARSLFLQGLLLSPDAELPPSIKSYSPIFKHFFKYADELKLSPLQLALTYLLQTTEIDFSVVGCQSNQQLREIISAYEKIKSMTENWNLTELAVSDESLVNPSLW